MMVDRVGNIENTSYERESDVIASLECDRNSQVMTNHIPPFVIERAPCVFYAFVSYNETWRLLAKYSMLLWAVPMLLRQPW